MAAGKVVGWFHGRMEFGPRALGARSIIGDARNKAMQAKMNLRIKFRESFRPFAPCVLAEDVSDISSSTANRPTCCSSRRVRRNSDSSSAPKSSACDEGPRPAQARERPALHHSGDHARGMSARMQTVDEQRHGRYYRLMREFKRQTGCGVIINTSFNIRGEPIVCTPQDAYRCFLAWDMDVLVLENCVLYKIRAAAALRRGGTRENRVESFQLDDRAMINPFQEINWNPDRADAAQVRQGASSSAFLSSPALSSRSPVGSSHSFYHWPPWFAAVGAGAGSLFWLSLRSQSHFTSSGISPPVPSARRQQSHHRRILLSGSHALWPPAPRFGQRPDEAALGSSSGPSYWNDAEKSVDPQTYFRQFYVHEPLPHERPAPGKPFENAAREKPESLGREIVHMLQPQQKVVAPSHHYRAPPHRHRRLPRASRRYPLHLPAV